jgi:L-threonylcarbamoyladenylate synthase
MTIGSIAIIKAVRVLRCGGLIAYPTEAVWGIGCAISNLNSVKKVMQLKRRPWHKGVIIVAADLQQVKALLAPLSDAELSPALATWPGPHNWLLPARRSCPLLLRGRHRSIAIRISAHPLLQALCNKVGPIVSTSANLAKRPAARTKIASYRAVGNGVDYVVPGKTLGLPRPSAIRDLRSGRIVRR